jgi:hypothetical protein
MTRLVTIATFETPIEASIARSALESAGIRAFLLDDQVAGMNWAFTNAIGGVKLQVSSDDLPSAKKVLNDASPAEFPKEYEVFDDGFGNEPSQEEESQDAEDEPLTPSEENADRAFRAAVFGLLFLPLQLYVSWLLLNIFFSNEPLRPRQRSRALLAGVINVPFLLIFLVLLKGFLTGF